MTATVPVAGVRPATEDDLATLEAMAARAAASLDGARGAALMLAREARPPARQDLRDLVEAVEATLLVGTLDAVAVGVAAARVESLAGGLRLAVITLLWVDEEARAVSVGEGLLKAVCDWARDQGCDSVDAYALPGERITKNFFEAAGFKARLLTVHHEL